jgi:hypothetical protein
MTQVRPGGYDRVLSWLAGNSPATVNQACCALGITRSRALLVLRSAERAGDVSYARTAHARGGYPRLWSVTRPAARTGRTVS